MILYHALPKEYAEAQLDNQILQHKGSSLFYAYDYDQMRENLKKAEDAYKYYKELEGNIPNEDKWKIAVQKHFGGSEAMQLIPTEPKNPSEILDEFRNTLLKRMTHIHEASSAADSQAKQILDKREHIKSIEEYAVTQSARTIARAAEEAMAKSEKLEKPLYIAPENIFPESYGAHPQELKTLIQKSRERFVKDLVNEKHVNEKEAKKLAETHIKATFDMGHAYIWRKYFNGTDNEFNKWLLKEIDDLADNKIIGHIHIADNFGYADEHVTPGLGKVPIKAILEKLKKKGLTDVIVEPAHQDFLAMLGAWGKFGGPVYGVGPGVGGWTDVEHSYFGRTAPPYFLYGDNSPDPKEWVPWSQTRLE
jgi:sugar phosphate isomerase/epimerase